MRGRKMAVPLMAVTSFCVPLDGFGNAEIGFSLSWSVQCCRGLGNVECEQKSGCKSIKVHSAELVATVHDGGLAVYIVVTGRWFRAS